MFFNKRNLVLFKKLTIRKVSRNKMKYISQLVEITNDTFINDILNYMKIKHITDDGINSYMYILLYEFINISILMKLNEKKEHSKIIENSYIHICSYIILKYLYYNITKDFDLTI